MNLWRECEIAWEASRKNLVWVVILFSFFVFSDVLLKGEMKEALSPILGTVLLMCFPFFGFPFFSAGVLGAIRHTRRTGEGADGKVLLWNGCVFYTRVFLVIFVVTALSLFIRWVFGLEISEGLAQTWQQKAKLKSIDIPVAILQLFAISGIVWTGSSSMRAVWRTFCHLFFSPSAMAVGLFWGGFKLFCWVGSDIGMAGNSGVSWYLFILGKNVVEMPMWLLAYSVGFSFWEEWEGAKGAEPVVPQPAAERPVEGTVECPVESLVEPVVKTVAVESVAGEVDSAEPAVAGAVEAKPVLAEPVPVSQPVNPEVEGLLKDCVWLSLFSFFPPLGVAAMLIGWVATRQEKRASTRGLLAFWSGAFFCFAYGISILGAALPVQSLPHLTDYGFLAKADPQLAVSVDGWPEKIGTETLKVMLEKERQEGKKTWAFQCALAEVKTRNRLGADAVADFERAVAENPDQAECYFLFGRALFLETKPASAAIQLHKALSLKPEFPEARKILAIIENGYKLPEGVSGGLMLFIVVFLLAGHEFSHAWMARNRGDDTAEKAGRLTMNPMAHLDWFGSIILPLILYSRNSSIMFGWAKPVPFDPRNFKDVPRDSAAVSFAGPGFNLFTALFCSWLLLAGMFLLRLFKPGFLAFGLVEPQAVIYLDGIAGIAVLAPFIAILKLVMYTSLALGLFNLIPAPPLDGSWILSGLLPAWGRNLYEKLRPFSFLLIFMVVLTPIFDYFIGIPILVFWGIMTLFMSFLGFQ
jgi:Zn-dependent protease